MSIPYDKIANEYGLQLNEKEFRNIINRALDHMPETLERARAEILVLVTQRDNLISKVGKLQTKVLALQSTVESYKAATVALVAIDSEEDSEEGSE